jgi:hypothetical protein
VRARLIAALAVLVVATAVGTGIARGAVMTGISDESSAFMSEQLFTALDVTHVRLVMPWDAALTGGPWGGWLRSAHAAGLDVLVALEHDSWMRCPGLPCFAPTAAEYRTALRSLLVEYPWVRALEPWNEPNSRTQPTFTKPQLAAGYWNAAAALCPSCTLVAGDMLDDAELDPYLQRYHAALDRAPAVWGLHDYYDATYFTTTGADTMLARTSGELWMTETGGVVSHGAIQGNELGAAASAGWVYGTAAARPRITRLYMYQWRGNPLLGFDSGLLNPDGTPRPAYYVVAAHTRPSPRAPRMTAASVRLAGRKPVRLGPGARLTLTLACVGASALCQGVVRIVAAGASPSARFRVAPDATLSIRVALPAAAARRLKRERHPAADVTVCAAGGAPCAARRTVAVAIA